jgi:hypothetical protein
MTQRDRLITKIMSLNKPTISLQTAMDIVDAIIDEGVIVPPCNVGDTVYPLNADSRFRAIVEKIEINANEILFCWVQYDIGVDCTECWDEDLFTIDDIGKTVFLDETEYLIALKEREKQ